MKTDTTTQKAITVQDLRDDIETLRHAGACAAPDLKTFVGKFGDQMLQCRECGRFRPVETWMIASAATVMQEPPEPPRTHHQPQNRPSARPCPLVAGGVGRTSTRP